MIKIALLLLILFALSSVIVGIWSLRNHRIGRQPRDWRERARRLYRERRAHVPRSIARSAEPHRSDV